MTGQKKEDALPEIGKSAPDEQNAQTNCQPRHRKRQDECLFDKSGPTLSLFTHQDPSGRNTGDDADDERHQSKPKTSDNRIAVQFENFDEPLCGESGFDAAKSVDCKGRDDHLDHGYHQKQERKSG